MSDLISEFRPPSWLANRHLQSVLPSLPLRRALIEKRAAAVIAASRQLVLDCGGGARLMGWHADPPAVADGAPRRLAVLLHGWEGSSESLYVLSIAELLHQRGFAVLRLNLALYGVDAELFACGLASLSGSAEFDYFPHATVLSGRFADGASERETVRRFLLGQQQAAGEGALSAAALDELLATRLERQRLTCPLRTLSEVIRERGVERIDLLKVDVEKAELDVLEGIAEQDWPRIRQVAVEVHDLDGRLESVRALLVRHGFAVAVEQDALVAGTDLYQLYAVRSEQPRPGNGAPPAPAAAPLWSSRSRLEAELRAHLQARLPDFMIPAAFALLDALPLTASGKLDRRALPAPEPGAGERRTLPPRDEVEAAVAAVWGELLGVAEVGVEDNFFDAGGHSLLATQLLARLRQRFGVAFNLAGFFAEPTVAYLARSVRAAEQAPPAPASGPRLRALRRGNRSLDELAAVQLDREAGD